MAWRGIHLSRPAHLSIEKGGLKLSFRDDQGGEFHQPLEDLSYLILDNPAQTLSGQCLAALAEANTLVVGSNRFHLPVWAALPWTSFHRQGEVLQIQLSATQPRKKQLWASIVKAKINAQAQCLENNNKANSSALKKMAVLVKSGDPENMEARAAKLYWSSLFPDRDFVRHQKDLPNALLNYGYAILRSALARSLCAIGFIPQLGIHHDSQANAYNLADDLIEPYRPLVDHYALSTLGNTPSDAEFDTPHRQAMIQMMEADLELDGEIFSTMASIEATTASLKHALSDSKASPLVFPTFTPE